MCESGCILARLKLHPGDKSTYPDSGSLKKSSLEIFSMNDTVAIPIFHRNLFHVMPPPLDSYQGSPRFLLRSRTRARTASQPGVLAVNM